MTTIGASDGVWWLVTGRGMLGARGRKVGQMVARYFGVLTSAHCISLGPATAEPLIPKGFTPLWHHRFWGVRWRDGRKQGGIAQNKLHVAPTESLAIALLRALAPARIE